MSYRVGTPNYNLPQTEGTDKRDWSDTNQAFLEIDTAIKNAVDTSTSASSAAGTAQQTADSANTAASHAQTDATTAQTLATSASELATTAKNRADSAYTLAQSATTKTTVTPTAQTGVTVQYADVTVINGVAYVTLSVSVTDQGQSYKDIFAGLPLSAHDVSMNVDVYGAECIKRANGTMAMRNFSSYTPTGFKISGSYVVA